MASRMYLFFVCIGSLLCWIAWFFVIWNTDPQEPGKTGVVFFYVSLGLAFLGTCSLLSFLTKNLLLKKQGNFLEFFKKNFLSSFGISIISMTILFLFHMKLLVWWNSVLFVILLAVLKGFMIINRKYVR